MVAGQRKVPTMAEMADKHELYEESVQNVEEECLFITTNFQKIRGRAPLSFREDFCGTASACCEWVRKVEGRTAIGVDLDPEVLAWGLQNRVGPLSEEQQQRVKLIEDNVLSVQTEKVDVVGAFNFSYFIFQQRQVMKQYFRAVYDSLKDDGMFFLDAFGGYEAFEEMKEKTKYTKFTYIWEQAVYYPVTGEMTCYIHFKFPDGSKMKRAFEYTWRLWTLPEILEMLSETGFRNPTVYWEGTDEDDEGDGVFTPEAKGEADAGWIAYIVAEK
ncbi:MAG: class I SAM-dependent methyltransferase [Gammaproteobacteria bacterium]|nr:class I SAM-dependent methyltransferase [Gammaproteobacteria bacterium]